MRQLLLAAFFFIGFNVQAQENVPTDHEKSPLLDIPVGSDRLKLLGNGIRKGKTDESLALACVDELCTSIGFVHFKNAGDAHWVGYSWKLPQANGNSKLQKEADEVALQVYLSGGYIIKKHHHGWFYSIVVPATGVFAPPGIATLVPLTTAASAFLIFGVPIAALIGFDIYLRASDERAFSHLTSQSYTATHDQNGWNWGVRGTKIKPEKFDEVLQNILTVRDGGRPKEYEQGQLYDKAQEKLEKLKLKGVVFY